MSGWLADIGVQVPDTHKVAIPINNNNNEGTAMKEYRVSIWNSINVQADNEKQAEEIAYKKLINGEIKFREFEFNAEERD